MSENALDGAAAAAASTSLIVKEDDVAVLGAMREANKGATEEALGATGSVIAVEDSSSNRKDVVEPPMEATAGLSSAVAASDVAEVTAPMTSTAADSENRLRRTSLIRADSNFMVAQSKRERSGRKIKFVPDSELVVTHYSESLHYASVERNIVSATVASPHVLDKKIRHILTLQGLWKSKLGALAATYHRFSVENAGNLFFHPMKYTQLDSFQVSLSVF